MHNHKMVAWDGYDNIVIVDRKYIPANAVYVGMVAISKQEAQPLYCIRELSELDKLMAIQALITSMLKAKVTK